MHGIFDKRYNQLLTIDLEKNCPKITAGATISTSPKGGKNCDFFPADEIPPLTRPFQGFFAMHP